MPNWFNKKSMPLETKGKSFPLLAMKWLVEIEVNCGKNLEQNRQISRGHKAMLLDHF